MNMDKERIINQLSNHEMEIEKMVEKFDCHRNSLMRIRFEIKLSRTNLEKELREEAMEKIPPFTQVKETQK